MANVTSATKFFPMAQDGFSTTTTGIVNAGASTVPLTSTGAYTNGDIVVQIIDPGVTGKQTTFTGVIDTVGLQVTGVVWTAGATGANHSSGATVVDYISATHQALNAKGWRVEHNQDGTHGAITSTNAALTTAALTSPTFKGLIDGWINANESWTYASATTITVPTDATTKYDIGDWIKLTQSATVKYFIVTGVAATVLTVAGLAGATVANSSITANAYSKARNPHGNGLLGAIPYNPYKFFAYNNAVQNVANNTKLTFNTKVYDTGNNFDAVTNNYFTAPIAGFYFFGASIYVQSAGTFNINGAFMKNVSTQIGRFGFTAVQGSGNDQQISGFVSAQLAANDTVQVNYLASATRNVYGASGDLVTCFTGYLVSAL